MIFRKIGTKYTIWDFLIKHAIKDQMSKLINEFN